MEWTNGRTTKLVISNWELTVKLNKSTEEQFSLFHFGLPWLDSRKILSYRPIQLIRIGRHFHWIPLTVFVYWPLSSQTFGYSESQNPKTSSIIAISSTMAHFIWLFKILLFFFLLLLISVFECHSVVFENLHYCVLFHLLFFSLICKSD